MSACSTETRRLICAFMGSGKGLTSRDRGQIDWSGNPLYAIKILATMELRRLYEGYIEDIGFHEQRDGSFLRLSEEGERKSCEPAVRWNIRHNTFRMVLEGDVVKRSANNARDLCVGRGVEVSHSFPSKRPSLYHPLRQAWQGMLAGSHSAALPLPRRELERASKKKLNADVLPEPPFDLRKVAGGFETIMSTNSCVANRFAEIARGGSRIGLEDPLDTDCQSPCSEGRSIKFSQEST